MDLNGWGYYELEKEMRESSVFQLMELFKREDRKYTEKCTELVKSFSKLDEVGKKSMEKECDFLQGSRLKLALRIAETLTKE